MNLLSNRIILLQGDITQLKVDAIVNAANSSLMGGGGVDGAIHCSGGPAITAECANIVALHGRCEPGNAVITTGGKLPATYIIHTVGPVWHGGKFNEDQILKNAYSNSLQLAAKKILQTIAFPNISTGVYGFPKDRAAQIAVRTVQKFLEENEQIRQVYFVCFDKENYELYERLILI